MRLKKKKEFLSHLCTVPHAELNIKQVLGKCYFQTRHTPFCFCLLISLKISLFSL